jgi:hypothetical protein
MGQDASSALAWKLGDPGLGHRIVGRFFSVSCGDGDALGNAISVRSPDIRSRGLIEALVATLGEYVHRLWLYQI